MSGRLINTVLIVLFVVFLAANLLLGRRGEGRRGFEFLPTMVHSVPYDAYSEHPLLPGGMAMQEPPEGVIARGRMPLHYGASPEEALRAGRDLKNPIALASAEQVEADLARGQHLFGIYCLLCHGPEGRGDGTVAQRGFPAPPAFNSETSVALRDGQIFHIITFGQNNMPGHKAQIDPIDRWRIVQYVRQLRLNLAPTGEPSSPSVAAEPLVAVTEDDAGDAMEVQQ